MITKNKYPLRGDEMRKGIGIILACSLMFVTACSQTEHVSQLDLENKIETLTQQMEKLNTEIEGFHQEKENFAVISNVAREFVRASTSGDEEKLRTILSGDIVLEREGNKITAIIDGVEWLLFSEERVFHFDDWVIQGYHYNSDENTYEMFIREFYTDSNQELVSPPTFLHVTFKKNR